MSLKGLLALMLCLSLIGSCLSGCTPGAGTETTGTSQETTQTPQTTAETTEATEATEPDDGSFKMYYDDRLALTQLTGAEVTTVEIKDQQVTSSQVGSSEPDTAVLSHDAENGRLIAVGTGKATVVADGTEYPVTVRPAKISLFMIVGHSLGFGEKGNEAQSVVCPEGQVYSTILTDAIGLPASDVGLGYSSANKPNGIDAFTAGGTGRVGEGAGLGYRWNQLTGEKAWVLNAAVGGSCLNEWVQGTTNFSNATALFLAAESVLVNEIKAGHYTLKNMALIYHSAANFGYKNVTFDNATLEYWYQSMWNGFKDALSLDLDADGTAETLDAIGLVPLWTQNSVSSYELDRPANFYMASSDAYPDMFMASLATQKWIKDTGSFPTPDYATHGEEVKAPAFAAEMFAIDAVHLNQVVYNAAGIDIAENLYTFLRTKERAQSVKLVDNYGSTISDKIKMKAFKSKEFVVLLEDGCAADLTFTVTGNLELSYPLVVKTLEAGTGTLTICQGDTVLKTVTFTIE